jgi:hypothetical protein
VVANFAKSLLPSRDTAELLTWADLHGLDRFVSSE